MNRTSSMLKKIFESEARIYDKNVRDIFPQYLEMQGAVVDAIGFKSGSEIDVLDFGAGTGLTIFLIAKKFRKSKITGVDISSKMLDLSRVRLKKYTKRVELVEKDYDLFRPAKKYDVCVSVLYVHHLNSKEKKRLFSRVFRYLKNNGVFIIGDLILGDSKKETKKLEVWWEKFLVKKLGRKKADEWLKTYREEDKPDSVKDQLRWLKESGFSHAKCAWRKKNCAVLVGKIKTL